MLFKPDLESTVVPSYEHSSKPNWNKWLITNIYTFSTSAKILSSQIALDSNERKD